MHSTIDQKSSNSSIRFRRRLLKCAEILIIIQVELIALDLRDADRISEWQSDTSITLIAAFDKTTK